MTLSVPDLSVFFDIVQQSLLDQNAGYFIEQMSNQNIRKGLELVNEFLTSGHIQADKAIKIYLDSEQKYVFRFHEIFKGAILGQWLYYQENKSTNCINLFDSHLASKQLRLLRLLVLQWLRKQADTKQVEISVSECHRFFSQIGCSENHILKCLKDLEKFGLIRSPEAEEITIMQNIMLTSTGAYYLSILAG